MVQKAPRLGVPKIYNSEVCYLFKIQEQCSRVAGKNALPAFSATNHSNDKALFSWLHNFPGGVFLGVLWSSESGALDAPQRLACRHEDVGRRKIKPILAYFTSDEILADPFALKANRTIPPKILKPVRKEQPDELESDVSDFDSD